MAVFGQYTEIETIKQYENYENEIKNCLADFVHVISSFANYFEMKGVLKFWNVFVFSF